MSPHDLQAYLHTHIPLSQGMDVSVLECSPQGVLFQAPLAPNINHRDTLFGGSASAIAILAAWAALFLRLQADGLSGRLVIQRNHMEYLEPIDGPFQAAASAPDSVAWQSLVRMLKRRGIARITQHSELRYRGRVCGRMEGEFVVLGKTLETPLEVGPVSAGNSAHGQGSLP